MGIFDFLFGSESEIKKLPTMNKGQNKILNALISQYLSGQRPGGAQNQAMNVMQQYLNPNSQVYNDLFGPYQQQFEQEVIPGLAERFAGADSLGSGLSSSGFGQALSSAGSNLQSQLAQMKAGMQRQASGDINQQYNLYSQLGLGSQPYAYQEKPASAGFLPTALSGFIGGMGSGFGSSFGR